MSHRAAAFVVLAAVMAAPAARAAEALMVCYGFGCTEQAEVVLQAADWSEIARAFGRPRSAREERRAVARGIAAFERRIGARIGTDADLAGNLAGSGQPGQLDCIDESFNTTRYLHSMQDRGWLRWHRVALRARRARWWLDQHWTAVIEERGGARFAVDSWPRDNGREPDVQTLQDWLRKAPPAIDGP